MVEPKSGGALLMRPIAIFSYNRPQYLKRALESLAPQIKDGTKVFLYQDGPNSALTRRCISLFKEYFPEDKTVDEWVDHKGKLETRQNLVYDSWWEGTNNLGIAFNHKRARDRILETHDSAIFIEEDAVLNNYYIQMLNTVMDLVDGYKVGMVSCFGEHQFYKGIFNELQYLQKHSDSYTQQEINQSSFIPMRHMFAYGMFRESWHSIKDIMDGYYKLLPRDGFRRGAYKKRPHGKILDYMASHGIKRNAIVSSQDSCIFSSLTLKGYVNISTFTKNMVNIGELGEHYRPHIHRRHFSGQALYDKPVYDFNWDQDIRSSIANMLNKIYLRD